ncbi:hypothetical protein ACFL2A_02645 [Thermodesulfobacteriota bacterium]
MANKESLTKSKSSARLRSENITFLTPELVEIQGKNDRELLTLRVKLLLQAKEKMPNESIADIAKLGDLTACGAGCCCCCDTIVLPGSLVEFPSR